MEYAMSKKILEQNRKSYNLIAEDFCAARQEPWPEFELLKPYVKKGARILDWGCGHGRLYKFQISNFKFQIFYTGIDQSEELIKIAKKTYTDADFRVVDVFHLPFGDGEFDAVAAIASFHHIPGKELRLAALREIRRVLKPGGIVFMTNWNLFSWEVISHNVKRNKMNPLHFFFPHGGMDAGDFWIPFRSSNGGDPVPRYYHHFRKNELKALAKKAGFKIIFYRKGKNIIAVLKRD